jgi:PTH2 family peptidyl-tRNA hydrolase
MSRENVFRAIIRAIRHGLSSRSVKQTIVARADLGMGEGKLAAQVAHASLSAYEEADRRAQKRWKGDGQTKVVLKANGEDEIFRLAEKARAEGIPHAVVRDAGRTQLDSGTVTALAVGPADGELVDKVTGDLSLY